MAEPLPTPPPRPAPDSAAGAAPWFVATVVSWFTAWGMQHVLFSWLVVGVLRADPGVVGIAQTALMLPGVVGLLFGGVVADRLDRRRVLSALYAGAALLVAGMSAIVGAGLLTLPLLLLYAVAWGSAQAFVLPARDALVSDVAGPDLMHTITLMTLAQFAAQALGNALGGGARWIGTEAALGIQSAVLVAGLLPLARLRRLLAAPTERRTVSGGARAEMAEGLREVLGSERLRTLTLLVMGNGAFFVGPFFVVFPLLVRDVYRADVAVLSLAMMMFPLGTIAGSAVLLARGGIRRKGLALVGALLSGSATLAAQALGPPLWIFLALTFVWGLCGSVFLNTSRTLYQEAAPASHRGRVLSVYSMGLMGMAPVGMMTSGLVAGAIGGPATCALFGVAMAVLVGTVSSITRVTRLR